MTKSYIYSKTKSANTIEIDGNSLTIKELVDISRYGAKVKLSEESKKAIQRSRDYVEKILEENRVVYGITTGFGKFSDVSISKEDTKALQKNLIMSHACGTGDHLPEDIVRAVMLTRANALAKGYSGARLVTVQTLLDMLNHGVIPAIPEKGSLGASGDLAPLSHMVLTMIGLGEAYYNGELMDGSSAMAKAGIPTIELVAKEGLALINGTQIMTAIGALVVYDSENLMKLCDVSASMTGEALNVITDAFIDEMHTVRAHPYQLKTARNLRKILENSERSTLQGELRVQDPYSLRCIPQIHSASKDTIHYVKQKVEIEINAVTDNPIILPELDTAISGGNFHGQPMALPFDFLGIAIAELANVSERRIERLVNPQLSNGLPAFLAPNGGVCSGFMIAQYAAAALVSENKVLAHPASVDSIPSSANQEDHVSMGTIAARKAKEIYFNASRVIAIELTTAAQAIDLNAKDKDKSLGKGTQAAYDVIRKHITIMNEDRVLYKDLDKAAQLIDTNEVLDAVENAIGSLD